MRKGKDKANIKFSIIAAAGMDCANKNGLDE